MYVGPRELLAEAVLHRDAVPTSTSPGDAEARADVEANGGIEEMDV